MATTRTTETATRVTLAGRVACGMAGDRPVRLADRVSLQDHPVLADRLLNLRVVRGLSDRLVGP